MVERSDAVLAMQLTHYQIALRVRRIVWHDFLFRSDMQQPIHNADIGQSLSKREDLVVSFTSI